MIRQRFVICERSEAIQCGAPELDCFVAGPVIGPATSGRTRWLLAMTAQNGISSSMSPREPPPRAPAPAPAPAAAATLRDGPDEPKSPVSSAPKSPPPPPPIKLLRSFPISPIFACQPSAGPARGKGDRRVLAVIHTWPSSPPLRRGRPNICSYFVLTTGASENGEREVIRTSRRPCLSRRKWRAVVFAQHLLAGKSASHWPGAAVSKPS